jgi:hypothetical protein
MLVGRTATPHRADGVGLIEVYDGIHTGIRLVDAVARGYLVEPFGLRVPLQLDLDSVSTSKGDFAEKPLGELMRDPAIVQASVKAWLQHGERRKTIAFAVTVEHARALVDAFRAAGVRAELVHGGLKSHERQPIYADLANGALEVLVNVGVLTEGFDETSVACVMLTRPTQSLGLFTQMVGRGLRLHPGKPDCMVLDVTGTTRRKSLITLAMLGGLPAPPLEKDDPEPDEMQEARRKVERTDGKVTRTEGLLAVAREAERFDLMRIPRGRRYRWTEDCRGQHVLWLGSPEAGMLIVRRERDGDRHLIVHVHRIAGTPSDVDPAGSWRWDVQATDMHALDAIGLAEQEAARFNPQKGPVAVGPVDEEVLETALRDIVAREAAVNATRTRPMEGASRGATAAAIAELRRHRVQLSDVQAAALTHGEAEQLLRAGHASRWRAVKLPDRLKGVR